MALDLTSFDAGLKQHYTNDMIENMVYSDNPLFAMMSKMEDFGGRNLPIPTIYGNPQGRSATFARAQTRGALAATKIDDFIITRVKDYSIATIDNETLEASKGNSNAFLEAATLEIDGAINSLTRSVAVSMYRQGYGELAQIGSISTTTITLSNINDITNFEVGMELDVAATVTGAVRAYGTSNNGLFITGVDRSTGVLTFGFNVTDATNGIPNAAASDFIFVRGDHSGSTLTKLAGLEAWIPQTAPSSTAFFGVDRTADLSRLSGQRKDFSAFPIEEALVDGAALVAREAGKLTHYFMSYAKFAELEKALGAKVQYIDMQGPGTIAFKGISVNGPRGPIAVVPDQNCPSNRVFGLSLPHWKLYSLGKAVRVVDTDGLSMLRQASADGVEVRYGMYGQMGCRAPGFNINIAV
jgi:hypothetical protein